MSRISKRRITMSFAVLVIAGTFHSPSRAQEELYRIEGDTDEYLGTELDRAGDLDHDGVQELVARGRGDAGVWSGRTGLLLFKTAIGYVNEISPIGDLDGDGTSDLLMTVGHFLHAVSGADGHELFTIPISDIGDSTSHATLGIDDIDGDGVADLAVGSWWYEEDWGLYRGALHVYSSASRLGLFGLYGLDPNPSWGSLGGKLRLGPDLDGDGLREILVATMSSGAAKVVSPGARTVLFSLTPPNAGTFSPTCCEHAGDFDGDGIGDVLVGDATANDDAGTSYGVLSVFSGATQQLLHSFHGPPGAKGFGQEVARIEQLDGDGIDDFVVSNLNYFVPVSQVHLFSGASLSLLYSHTGGADWSRFGIQVRALGDLDGDGFSDYAVSAPQEVSTRNNGVIHVYRGNDLFLDAEPSVVPVGSVGSLTLREGPSFGLNAVAAVEVNGTPMFSLVFGLGTFDVSGTWQYSATVPPGLAGTTVVFVGYADNSNGRLIESGRETIEIP